MPSRVYIATFLMALGCGQGDRPSAPQRETSRPVIEGREGDTILVQNSGPGLWGGLRVLREDLRIGQLSGPAEVAFGTLVDLAVAPDGTIYTYDEQDNRIMRFDSNGKFLGGLGGPGQGPGEYGYVNGIAVDRGGSIFVRDRGQIIVFDSVARYHKSLRVISSRVGDAMVTAMNDGTVAVKVTAESGGPWRSSRLGFRFISADGDASDTIIAPTTPWDDEAPIHQPTLHPSQWTEITPDGSIVRAVSSRLAFQVTRRDGAVIRVDSSYDPVDFIPAERAAWEGHNRFMRRRWGPQGNLIPPAPREKPVFSRIIISSTGELWFRRAVESVGISASALDSVFGMPARPEWDEPMRLDVFRPDGAFLGQVTGPPRLDIWVARGDTLWGYDRGPMGEQYIVRWVAIGFSDER